MNSAYDILISVFGDRASSMVALMVFLAAAVLAFGIMAAAHARSSVKRRAAGIAEYSGERDAAEKNRCAVRASGRCSACSTTPPSTIRRTKVAATRRSCGAG